MITDHQTSIPPAEQQHRYPPAAATAPQTHRSTQLTGDTAAGAIANDADLITYIVHTDSHGLSDVRLQVSQEASSSKQALRPVYFRQRTLTEHDEIVDNIVDANTGVICWTIHRPTRGWYLYLRSPALPKGTAISFRSGSRDQDDPSASSLAFSVNTRVRMHALERLRPRIATTTAISGQNKSIGTPSTATRGADGAGHGLAICLEEEQAEHGSQSDAAQSVAVAATGREERKAASSGHARRRSGATGSGSHSFDPRNPNKRPSSTVAHSPRIPETDDESSRSNSHQHNRSSLSRLAIPTTNVTSSSSSPQSSGGDRPYSPTLPSTPNLAASSATPRTSTFLLTDSQACQQAAMPRSWARWAYSILPTEIRPSLSLDADKSFSLYWLNPPTNGQRGTAAESVEVVRFQDQSGRWMWNSHTRGRLTLQTGAMQAVGLQKEFWITAALAYIQFLEDKDAYEAARDA